MKSTPLGKTNERFAKLFQSTVADHCHSSCFTEYGPIGLLLLGKIALKLLQTTTSPELNDASPTETSLIVPLIDWLHFRRATILGSLPLLSTRVTRLPFGGFLINSSSSDSVWVTLIVQGLASGHFGRLAAAVSASTHLRNLPFD